MPAAGPIIGAVASVGGAAMQANAAGDAADASAGGSAASNRTQWNMFNANAQLNDWQRVGGGRAYNEYLQMMGMAPVHIATASEILSPYAGQYGGSAATTSGGGFDIFNPLGTHSRGGIGGALTLDPLGLFGGGDSPPTPVGPYAGGDEMRNDGIPGNYAAYQAEQGRQHMAAANLANSPNAPGTPTTGYTADQVMERLQATPGYQARATEGRTQIEASAAARGGLNSGATLRALQRYGQDYNTNEYGNYMNRLSVLFGGAQTASNNLGQAAMNTGANIGQNQVNAGNARANMYVNQSNAYTGALGSLGSLFGNSFGYGSNNYQPWSGPTGGNGSASSGWVGGGTGGGP